MILYYAPGGGRGHVTRARRVLERLGIENAVILATMEDESGVTSIPRELQGDVERHAQWLRSFAADHLILDTFPAGIQGELEGVAAAKIDYVARLLRWDAYREAVPCPIPRFETTYVVEGLTECHEAFVRMNSASVIELDLKIPAHAGTPSSASPYWLIVHSGPTEEVQELIAYCAELRKLTSSTCEVVVATPCEVDLPSGFRRVNAVPAAPLYGNAARIITAAGFNVMLETEPWRDRHTVLPFPRRFDDQFLRAARRATARNVTASGS